jgi:FtsZ-binding cell division protein ZapB
MNRKIKLIKKLNPIDFVRKIKNENMYLKNEMKEEKEKLETTIRILNRELDEVKEDNRKLNNEVEHYLKIKENMYYTI